MSELHELTALEQAATMRRREVSPVQLLDHYLDRIDRLDAKLGAFITVTPELGRTQAREAERTIRRAADEERLPPLLGVPVPIKDLTMVEGVRATLGSLAYAEFIAPYQDHVVTKIRAAGGVIVGKTNTPEFGLPCYTENALTAPARTPWDLDSSAGGSSGGAAAAVAGGLAPLAHGNDGAGSVRIPASLCGLVGIKPSRHRISNGPIFSDITGLVTHGPLARTVRDAAALLDAMSGAMPDDAVWPPAPGGTFLDHADSDPGRLRIGRFMTPVIAEADIHPDCVAAYEQASALLGELGHEVEDIAPPFSPEVIPTFEKVWAVSSALVPVDPALEDRLLPLTRWLRERGREVSGVGFAQALQTMALASREWLRASGRFDAVLTPTLAQPPPRVGGIRDDGDPARDFESQKRFTPFTAAYNVTGQPAVSVPLHWNGEGLPVGVMLAGRPAAEATLIALAAQLEAARPWAHRRPPTW
ncbi:MAG: amidase [Carbonactinosporaceae bacterium]